MHRHALLQANSKQSSTPIKTVTTQSLEFQQPELPLQGAQTVRGCSEIARSCLGDRGKFSGQKLRRDLQVGGIDLHQQMCDPVPPQSPRRSDRNHQNQFDQPRQLPEAIRQHPDSKGPSRDQAHDDAGLLQHRCGA